MRRKIEVESRNDPLDFGMHPPLSRWEALRSRLSGLLPFRSSLTEESNTVEEFVYRGSSGDIKSQADQRIKYIDRKAVSVALDAKKRGASQDELVAIQARRDGALIEAGVQAIVAMAEDAPDPRIFLAVQLAHSLAVAEQKFQLFNEKGRKGDRTDYAVYTRVAQRLEEEIRKRYPLP